MSISPYFLKDGTKRFRVRYTAPDGKRTDERGFKTMAAARRREAELITGAAPRTETKPLRHYLDALNGRIERKTPGTIDTYQSAMENHIIPAWGNRTAHTITRQEVQAWIDVNGWGTSVCMRNLSLLKQWIACAGVDDRENPVFKIDKPKRGRKENLYLNFSQLTTLANAARTDQHMRMVFTLGTVGLRWGELAGLRVKDLALNDRNIHIWQTVSVVRNQLIVGPPKNGRDRWVSAPQFVCDYLREQARGRAADSPVFPGPSGDYLRRPKGRSWYDGMKKRANLVDPTIPVALRLHDLRHTAASLMVSNGASVLVVQRQLGHLTASETTDRYADLFFEDLSAATAGFDALFNGGQNVGTDLNPGGEHAGQG